MADTIGAIQVVATINTKDYDAAKKRIERGNDDLEKSAEKTSKGFSAAWAGAIGGLVATVAQKGFAMISSSIDGAVKRVDTLNNSARTFENMGIAATDSSSAVSALEKSIKGLPTPLDGAIRGMTALTATYGDINKGQKVFSALNNAILGFGGTASMVDNAITQLSQLPMDGPLDAQTWNSLRNSGITPVLVAMAKESGMSVSEMKEAFGKGELTVQDFTDRLVKLNEKGGGGLKSLEKIAKDSTSGIGTGFSNMQTAIVRGMGKVIEAVGSKNISNAISNIGKGFENTLNIVARCIPQAVQIIKSISPAVIVVTASIAAYQLTVGIATAATKVYAAAMAALNAVMKANPVGLLIGGLTGLVAIFALVNNSSNTNKAAQDRLNTALAAGKTATDNLKNSEQQLKDARLAVEGSALAVERAQRIYNETVQQYGPNSLEAREAAYQLKRAQDDLATANKNVTDRTKDNINAQKEFSKTKQEIVDAQNAVAAATGYSASQYERLANTAKEAAKAQKEIANQGGRSTPQQQLKAAGLPGLGRGFSVGGFTGRGNANDVAGIVHKGEYVVPKHMVNQSTGLPEISGSSIEYNIANVNISSEVDGERWLRRLTNNQEIVSAGLVPNHSWGSAQ